MSPRWFGAARKSGPAPAPKRPSGAAAAPGAPAGGSRTSAGVTAPRRAPFGWRARLKWVLYVTLGVAVMAGAGYLVAALVLFPAPLLPNQQAVARVIALSEADARAELERLGFVTSVTREPHSGVPAGTVFWQDPPPGVALSRGATVELLVSAGLRRVEVPLVAGFDADLAAALLRAAGLRVESVQGVDAQEFSSGVAFATAPSAGDSVPLGTGVLLHVAR